DTKDGQSDNDNGNDDDDDDNDDDDDDDDDDEEDSLEYPEFIRENRIETEFGMFLACLAKRMVAEHVYAHDPQFAITQRLFVDLNAEKCLRPGGNKLKMVPVSHATLLSNAYDAF